eukprot:265009-Alexandrium_andersonii.AAC.1
MAQCAQSAVVACLKQLQIRLGTRGQLGGAFRHCCRRVRASPEKAPTTAWRRPKLRSRSGFGQASNCVGRA